MDENYEKSSSNDKLAGCYDPKLRQLELNRKLKHELELIRKEDIYKTEPKHEMIQDGISERLFARLQKDFEVLKTEARKYNPPHFTKEYRSLQERCGKLERSLDKVDVSGKYELRENRRSLLLRVDKLTKYLAQRAHPDGKCCPDCEIKM
ncbi:hypothetical protein Ocin01_12005 [Orchesella cincta]|uniref:BAG domain-containing protein n=1 Tax=Orchesella cincta TaxID=48709 RepID=A0A1D2MP53_ORCCI|nr:hypothetical protein Ocin01_12005 [Orchesella cincta]